MDKKEVYLDYAATTPMDPRVREAMAPFLDEKYGNPSSIHRKGREAREALDHARETVAGIFHAQPDEIVFTGGGTEAINLALFGAGRQHKPSGQHIVTTKIEHHAVLHACDALEKEGCEATYLRVDAEGRISHDAIAAALRPDTVLVSVMYANNEIGTVEPIAEIAKELRTYRQQRESQSGASAPSPKRLWRVGDNPKPPFFFVDACQAAGALTLNVAELGVDMMVINGSKIYGPKGVGCLYVRRGIKLQPLIYGGGQEKGLRSGTENVAGIVGFATALEIAERERVSESTRLTALRDGFIAVVLQRIPNAVLNGHATERLPNNINISIPGLEGEVAVLYLDARSVYCSTGSACSATSLEPSHVIAALGRPRQYADGSLRFTLGRGTTKDDLDYVLEALVDIVGKLRRSQ
ncbi:MAG: cysteine desulfurase [Candidatus Sungbacteria bacterium]|nr:cysteine desulfurase [Candidatus Sungbacteria bacterium]